MSDQISVWHGCDGLEVVVIERSGDGKVNGVTVGDEALTMVYRGPPDGLRGD